jgi:hypothetical protein
MIHPKCLILEYQQGKHGKYYQRYHFLYYFELEEAEWPTISIESYPIGRHLKGIFKQCNTPADQNNADKAQTAESLHVFKFQMAIPRHCHKRVRYNEQYDGDNCFLHKTILSPNNEDPKRVNEAMVKKSKSDFGIVLKQKWPLLSERPLLNL